MAGRIGNVNGQALTNLYSFGSLPQDGTQPYAGLVQGIDGNFYGTTCRGGTNYDSSSSAYDLGTVFRISPSGSYTNLHSFAGPPDGAVPQAGLVQGSDGNLYGTTVYGGTSTNDGPVGGGTVFRISPSGSYTNLYSFPGLPNDGAEPSGLVQGSDGNFYGTTLAGGTTDAGTVFRISPNGSYTNFYSFPWTPNYETLFLPVAGLVQGSDGNFYGTTLQGGTYGEGTVFRISPNGSYTNLHSFFYSSDGGYPHTGLVQGSDGNFYGTTDEGGMNFVGSVYRISPSGSYTNLCFFPGYPDNGGGPIAGLVQGSDGNFYGTTLGWGSSNAGTVFRISPSGIYTNIYSFGGSPSDGSQSRAGLIQGSGGDFYGTTSQGGINNSGTVFRLSVPLNPPANQISGIRITGNSHIVSIPSVAYETYQLQFTTDLTSGTWSNVPGASVTNSIGALLTLTNFGGAVGPQGFYRFDITP